MSFNREFEDKVVLLTGLSSPASRLAAQVFSAEGAKVVLADEDEKNVFSTLQQFQKEGRTGHFIQTVLTSEKDVAELFDEIMKTYGRLDLAFNDSAAISDTCLLKNTADLNEAEFDRLIETQLKAIWLCMKYELLKMRAHTGSAIVNAASILARSGRAGWAAFSAAKHGVIGLTQAAAREYALAGIRVNAVCPGLRSTKTESVVDVIVWLFSNRSSFVSGQAIVIEGGRLDLP